MTVKNIEDKTFVAFRKDEDRRLFSLRIAKNRRNAKIVTSFVVIRHLEKTCGKLKIYTKTEVKYMDRKIDRNIARWVIALLVVGIIVGLIFLYNYIDSGSIDIGNILGIDKDGTTADKNGVTGDGNGGNNNGGGNNGGNAGDVGGGKDDNVEEPPKRTLPRAAVDGVLEIGGDGNDVAVGVADFMKGQVIIALSDSKEEDFVGDGYRNIALAYIEGDSVIMTLMLEENEDVDYIGYNVNEYGLAVIGKGQSDVIVYQVNYSFKFVERRVIENVDGGDVKIFEDAYSSDLNITYRSNGKTFVGVYDTGLNLKSVLSIEFNSIIKGIFQRRGGGIMIATESGIVIESDYKGISKRDIGMTVEEIAVVPVKERSGYAVIGVCGGVKKLAVFDMTFDNAEYVKTDADKIIVADALYTLRTSDGLLTRHCSCAEAVESIETDIKNVVYSDYPNRRVVYTSFDGKNKIAYFDEGIASTEETSEAYVFVLDGMSISNNGEIRVEFHRSGV